MNGFGIFRILISGHYPNLLPLLQEYRNYDRILLFIFSKNPV